MCPSMTWVETLKLSVLITPKQLKYFGASLFGRGWSFAHNEQITSDEEGNLYYTRSDGSILTFKKDGDTYQAPEGYDLTLTIKDVETKKADFGNGEEEYQVKEYHITDTDQVEKVFNFHGLLASQNGRKRKQNEPYL